MPLAIHMTLLALVVVVAVALVAWRPGRLPRPTPDVVVAVAPLLVVGVICQLLLSAAGKPSLEWAVPALAVLAVGLGCRSEGAFRAARWGFLAASLVLCDNFMTLVQLGGYTADPGTSRTIARALQRTEISRASDALMQAHAAGGELPAGPLSALLHRPGYDQVEGRTIERLWHTPLTGLYRVRRTRGSLWYPGGDVMTASRRIEWRPATQGKG
jgi:hypothetical protein